MDIEIINGITVEHIAIVVSAVIAGASGLVAAARRIAAITPTTKDDEYVSAAKRLLGRVIAVADRLALNPDSSEARPGKGKERG